MKTSYLSVFGKRQLGIFRKSKHRVGRGGLGQISTCPKLPNVFFKGAVLYKILNHQFNAFYKFLVFIFIKIFSFYIDLKKHRGIEKKYPKPPPPTLH
jgi:hypothetical protein